MIDFVKIISLEDTKRVIRKHKLKNDRQYNGQQKDEQRSTKQSIKKSDDRAKRTSLKAGVQLSGSGRVGSFCSKC